MQIQNDWRLAVASNSKRMIAAAMEYLDDANEARWLVHGVMLGAMTNITAPISRRELDTALGRALRLHANTTPVSTAL